ncbi:MAG TPA: hypothetical protein VHA07_02055 [Devosia sp.]|nr:hypothetical protein [Devosia sp.]
MRASKPIIPNFGESARDGQREARQLALEYLAEAWNTAEDEGVDTIALAHASLFAALATLVREHGEEATAGLVAGLPDRIRSGEYNLERQTH